jgi:Family of unknown function (DUF6069)
MVSKSASSRRVIIAGSVAIVVSMLVNVCIGLIAKNAFQISSRFVPLAVGAIIFWSVVLGIGALLVFLGLRRWTRRPLMVYMSLSIVVYIFTFIPDAWLLSSSIVPGTTASAVLTLMMMHAAEAIILLGTFAIIELRRK